MALTTAGTVKSPYNSNTSLLGQAQNTSAKVANYQHMGPSGTGGMNLGGYSQPSAPATLSAPPGTVMGPMTQAEASMTPAQQQQSWSNWTANALGQLYQGGLTQDVLYGHDASMAGLYDQLGFVNADYNYQLGLLEDQYSADSASQAALNALGKADQDQNIALANAALADIEKYRGLSAADRKQAIGTAGRNLYEKTAVNRDNAAASGSFFGAGRRRRDDSYQADFKDARSSANRTYDRAMLGYDAQARNQRAAIATAERAKQRYDINDQQLQTAFEQAKTQLGITSSQSFDDIMGQIAELDAQMPGYGDYIIGQVMQFSNSFSAADGGTQNSVAMGFGLPGFTP